MCLIAHAVILDSINLPRLLNFTLQSLPELVSILRVGGGTKEKIRRGREHYMAQLPTQAA